MKNPPVFIWLLLFTCKLFAQPPQTANDIFRQGVLAYQQSNYDVSFKYLSQAIQMDPARYYYYYNRGITLMAMGNTQEAASDFRKSNDIKPTGEAFYQLGIITYQQGNVEEAKAAFQSAHQLKDNLGGASFYLGLISFKDKKYEYGYKYFRDCIEHNYANADVNYYKGYCEAELGMHNQSMQSLLLATSVNSRDWKYYLKMYEAYYLLGEKQLALNNITMVIELGQRKTEYYANRAELYRATGQESLAEEDDIISSGLKAPVLSELEHK